MTPLHTALAEIEKTGELPEVSWQTQSTINLRQLAVPTDCVAGWILTQHGRAELATAREKEAAAKKRRNAAARGRTAAMKSLGLVRGSAGWE